MGKVGGVWHGTGAGEKWGRGERETGAQGARRPDYHLIGRVFTHGLKRQIPAAPCCFDFSHTTVFILTFQVTFKGDFCFSEGKQRMANDTSRSAL